MVLLAAVAVVAYMMSNVSKADYKEALANIDEGEKSLTKQFDKALNTVKAGPNRSTDKDRKELEELMKKNQQAMEEIAKSKAFSKDPELKKKFDELREKQKNVDDYTVVSIETIFDVAPLRHNFRNISRHASNQAKADYVRGTVEKMKKIDAKSDFNKEFIKSMLEIYEGALEKITKAHADGSTLNLNSYAVKATRALLKWINAVSNQMKKQNPIKGGFEPIKNYLKSKAE